MAPRLSEQELAENYGFALAVLRADPSLRKIFHDAVAGSWTADKFAAAVRNSAWYKKNGENVRQYQLLKASDPGTLNARRAALRAQLADAASQMGAQISGTNLNRLVENSLMFGWNDSQVRDVLGGYVRSVNGVYYGAAGDTVEKLRQTAWRNGVRLSGPTLQDWAKNVATGNRPEEYFVRHIRQLAKTVAPGFAQELDAGMDLHDIANPYMEAKARILERNPAEIDLFDNDVRSALSGVTKDGKPGTQSLWQFEQAMRKKPEWLKTKNAQDAVFAAGSQVLKDFGFQ